MEKENKKTSMIIPREGDMIHTWTRSFYLKRDGMYYGNFSKSINENEKEPIEMKIVNLEELSRFKFFPYEPKR